MYVIIGWPFVLLVYHHVSFWRLYLITLNHSLLLSDELLFWKTHALYCKGSILPQILWKMEQKQFIFQCLWQIYYVFYFLIGTQCFIKFWVSLELRGCLWKHAQMINVCGHYVMMTLLDTIMVNKAGHPTMYINTSLADWTHHWAITHWSDSFPKVISTSVMINLTISYKSHDVTVCNKSCQECNKDIDISSWD